MIKVAITLATIVILGAALQGCGAIYAWDTMQLQSAKKQAAQQVLSDCNAGNKQACYALMGESYQR